MSSEAFSTVSFILGVSIIRGTILYVDQSAGETWFS